MLKMTLWALGAITVGVLLIATTGACGGGGGPGPAPTGPFNFLAVDVKVDQPLPATTADAYRADICCEGSNVYVVWEDDRNGLTDVYFNRSADGGLTWGPNDVRLDLGTPAGTRRSARPQICCDGLRIYVVWIDSVTGLQQNHVYFTRSLDGGLTWLPAEVKLDVGNAQPVLNWGADMCCVDDDVVVAWSDRRSGDDAIYLTRSTDAGTTWSGDAQVGGVSGTHAINPGVCCADVGGNLHVYVSWADQRLGPYDIFFDRSLDGGATWLPADVRQDSTAAHAYRPLVCCDGPNVYVGWIEGQTAQLNASGDSGTTFVGIQTLKTAGGGFGFLRSLCCEGLNVYALFEDSRDGARDIYFNRSTDGGVTLLPGGEIRLDVGDPAGANDSWSPGICCDGANLIAVWADDRTGSPTVWAARSANQGTNWFADVRLDTPGGPAQVHETNVQLCCSGSNGYVVWADDRTQAGLDRVRFNRTLDSGATWLANDVSPWQGTPAGANAASDEATFCFDGGTLHAAWRDRRTGDRRIFYNRSTNVGTTWMTADVQLDAGTPPLVNSEDPALCCDGANVYAVWIRDDGVGEDVYFSRSLDGGVTWLGAPVRLNVGVPLLTSQLGSARVCCDGLNVYVVWDDDRNGQRDILLNRSSDGGTTWLPAPERLDVGDAAGANGSFDPRICCDGSRVYVVWADARNGATDIYFNRSVDSGATWLVADVRLDVGDPAGASSSSLAVVCCEAASVYVAWSDGRNGDRDIYFNRSLDSGTTWLGADVRLDVGAAPGLGDSEYPALCCDGGRVYVAWEDERSGGDPDVYFNRSLDDGATWLAADVRLDASDPAGADDSENPWICCDGNQVFVAWDDERAAAPGPYFNASFDAGASWLPNELRVAANASTRTHSVHCLCDPSWIVVGWGDYHLSPGDIRVNRTPR